MKSLLLSSIAVIGLLFASCEKEEDVLTDDTQQNNSVEFKDQPLQGMISGGSWMSMSGTLDRDQFIMFGASSNNICDTENRPEADKISFFLFDVQPGVYELSAGGRVVLLQDHESGSNVNASEGKFEIQTVDTAANIVTGRVVAYWDDNNQVNGNFTVDYCFD